MAGTPSPGSGHLKIPLPHDPTDRPYDACLRPIFLRRDRSGPGPAEDRPAIFGRALLQRFGPTSRPQAQRKPLPDTERLQRHQHGSGPAYPEHLSVAEPELASRRGGGPRGSRPGLLPRPLPPRCSTFRSIPTCSLWTGTFGLGRIDEFRFLPGCVTRPRRPFPVAATRCRPVSCPAIACFSPGRPAESHRVRPSLCRRCRRGPAVPDYPQGRVAGARPARFAETGQVRRNRRPENGDRRPLPDMRHLPVLGRLSG